MKVKINRIKNQGDQAKEFVTIEVLQDCDIGDYILSDSSYTEDGSISNKLRHVYWLPDQKVKAGDFIQIYTGQGKSGSFKNKAGSITYKFYWGLNKPVWNDERDCAVVFEISAWVHKSV